MHERSRSLQTLIEVQMLNIGVQTGTLTLDAYVAKVEARIARDKRLAESTEVSRMASSDLDRDVQIACANFPSKCARTKKGVS